MQHTRDIKDHVYQFNWFEAAVMGSSTALRKGGEKETEKARLLAPAAISS